MKMMAGTARGRIKALRCCKHVRQTTEWFNFTSHSCTIALHPTSRLQIAYIVRYDIDGSPMCLVYDWKPDCNLLQNLPRQDCLNDLLWTLTISMSHLTRQSINITKYLFLMLPSRGRGKLTAGSLSSPPVPNLKFLHFNSICTVFLPKHKHKHKTGFLTINNLF